MATIKKLSAASVAKSDLKPNHYSDGLGLYSQVSKWHTKAWIFRYTLNGKARYMGLGSAAVFTLAEARVRARDAKKLLADGIDPLPEKTARKAAASQVTFRQAAERYIAGHKEGWSDAHTRQWETSLATFAFPLIGDLDVAAIDL